MIRGPPRLQRLELAAGVKSLGQRHAGELANRVGRGPIVARRSLVSCAVDGVSTGELSDKAACDPICQQVAMVDPVRAVKERLVILTYCGNVEILARGFRGGFDF